MKPNNAEERAFERYPDYKEMDGEYVMQIHKRKVFVEGYQQAKKDLELTWKDIKTIDKLLNQCIDYSNPYQEVLKRFKKIKEK